VPDLDAILAQIQEQEPLDVLENAYHTYFIEPSNSFNKTLFRYLLLRRLGSAGDPFALENAIGQLGQHPEENDAIAAYAAAVGGTARVEEAFLRLREQGLLPYDYQLYQVLRWRVRQAMASCRPGLFALHEKDACIGTGAD